MKETWRVILRPDPTFDVEPELITYLVATNPEGFKPFECAPKGNASGLVIGGLECVAENIAQVGLAAIRGAQALRELNEKKGKGVSLAFETVIYFDPVKE